MLRNLSARGAGLVAMLLVATAVHTAEVRITLNDRSSGRHCGDGSVLSAVPEEGDREPVEVLVSHPSSTVVTLDDTRPWRVSVRKNGCWSSTATWVPSSGSQLDLDLFSAATLHGTFTDVADQRSMPLRASMFRIVPDRNSAAGWPAAEPLDCSVELPKWRCTVPADLPIDVRLESEGFAPVHLWKVNLRPDQSRDAGPQKLIAGASLAGWVQDPDAGPLAGATVTLSPLQPVHPDAGRAVASQHRVVSNARGFFQFTGLPPGEYQLVSRAATLSPLVVPLLTVRSSTAVTWPRPLRHSSSVTLDVRIDPARTADGASWRVHLTERVALTPGSQPDSVPLVADDQGVWSAAGLRADRYELVIKDGADSIIERRDVDLSNGAPATMTISIDSIAVTGVVKVGDEPLAAADVRFTNARGKAVSVTTDEEGRFAAVFPSAGRWNPLVYPYGRRRRTEVRATPVEVSAEGDRVVEVVLSGGRIRGTVVTQTGAPVKAAVHITREGTLVAQQVTADDGRFDFIGLTEATYETSAQADDGAAPAPVKTCLAADETADLKVVIEPYRVVRGTVHTPTGHAASGALVRFSTDGGWSWSDLVTGVQGDFEYFLPAGIRDLEVVVVSYSYPAAMLRVPPDQTTRRPLSIQLLPMGGLLRVDADRAFIIRQDVVVPLNIFRMPRSLDMASRGAHLEPGSYAVCKQQRIDEDCRRVLIAPGTSTTVSFRPEQGRESAR